MYELSRVKVVKIGGNVIDNPEALADFIDKFSKLSGPKILVHGGGKEATRMAKGLGLETTMINGRRVTDAAMLDICTMVYAGLVNKRIVAAMQAKGIDAIGFSGADGDLIKATRRPANPVDYGFVGDISPIDVKDSLLSKMLLSGLTPVVCAIMHDGNGQLLNCNADSVASAVAIGISRQAKTDLIFCFEKNGVLADVDDENTLVRMIDTESFERMKASGAINSGMLPKIDNAMHALRSGVSEVYIKSAANLLEALGTLVIL